MYIIPWLLAILVEFIFLAITEEITVVGVIIITFGLMFLACLFKGDAAGKTAVIVMSLYCFLWGGLLCMDPLIRGTYEWGVRFITFVFAGGFGIAFILLGLYTGLVKVLRCTEIVEAVYVGASVYKVKTSESYSPIFEYKKIIRFLETVQGKLFLKGKYRSFFKKGILTGFI